MLCAFSKCLFVRDILYSQQETLVTQQEVYDPLVQSVFIPINISIYLCPAEGSNPLQCNKLYENQGFYQTNEFRRLYLSVAYCFQEATLKWLHY